MVDISAKVATIREATHSRDTASPFAVDGHAAFKREAKFGEERDGGIKVFHHNTDVVHALDCHDVALASNVEFSGARRLCAPVGTAS